MVSRKPLYKLIPDKVHCSMDMLSKRFFIFGDTDSNTVTLDSILFANVIEFTV